MRALDVAELMRLCPVVADQGSSLVLTQPQEFHDPYRRNGPNAFQRRYHNSNAKYKMGFGGLGVGKSTCIAREAFFHSVLRLRGLVHIGLVVSETYRHLADNTIPAFQRCFDPASLRGGSWASAFNRQSMTLHLYNGSTIVFRVTGNRRFEMLRGPEYAWACFDEGRNIPTIEPWNVIIARIRYPGIPENLLRVWGGSTPNGYDWQHEVWIKRSTDAHAWFHGRTADNAANLPAGYEANIRAVYNGEDAKQELDGLFISRSGAVYGDLLEKRWPEGNLFPASLDPERPTWAQMDFGYRNPRFQIRHRFEVGGEDGPSRVDVVVWELQMPGPKREPPRDMTIHEVVDRVRALKLKDLRTIYCDPAGDSANDQTHITSVQTLVNAFSPSGTSVIYPTTTRQRSIASGEATVRGLVKSASGYRRLCWAADRFRDESVAPAVKNSFEAMRALQYAPREPGKAISEKSAKDGVNDHDCDALRYWAVCDYGAGAGLVDSAAERAEWSPG